MIPKFPGLKSAYDIRQKQQQRHSYGVDSVCAMKIIKQFYASRVNIFTLPHK